MSCFLLILRNGIQKKSDPKTALSYLAREIISRKLFCLQNQPRNVPQQNKHLFSTLRKKF